MLTTKSIYVIMNIVKRGNQKKRRITVMIVEIRLINGKEDLLKDVEKIEIIYGDTYITYLDKEETIFMEECITFMTIKEDK